MLETGRVDMSTFNPVFAQRVNRTGNLLRRTGKVKREINAQVFKMGVFLEKSQIVLIEQHLSVPVDLEKDCVEVLRLCICQKLGKVAPVNECVPLIHVKDDWLVSGIGKSSLSRGSRGAALHSKRKDKRRYYNNRDYNSEHKKSGSPRLLGLFSPVPSNVLFLCGFGQSTSNDLSIWNLSGGHTQ